MFRGTHEAKVDEKGRLKLPADFMKVIAEKNYGAAFFVTSRNGKKTEIWPMPEWEIEEAKKAALPEDDAAKNAWMQIVNHFGGVMEIDKQDRVMLTRKVRERFGLINAEVVVRGQGKYLTVQTEQDAEQEIAEMLSPSDSDAKLITIAEARLILAQRESQKQGF
jgi:MraZ protein